MLDKKNLTILAKQVANADRKAKIAFSFNGKDYSYDALNSTLRDEFKELAGDYNSFRRNKVTLFEIMQEVVDEVMPKRVLEYYGQWAEIKQYGQGNKPIFAKKVGKNRAKKFITKVGLAGIYDVFKLDRQSFEIETTAYGGAAQIGLEEYLDGMIDFADLLEVIIEGLTDCVFKEIGKALTAMYSTMPGSQKASAANFDASVFDALLIKARAYGEPTIFTTLELASKIVPATNWIADEDKSDVRNQGYVGVYKGVKVMVIPQSYEDESLTEKVIDPSYAWILTNANSDKPIKIALEGETIIDEYVNYDRSREIQAYRKFGVGIVNQNDIFVYEDTAL